MRERIGSKLKENNLYEAHKQFMRLCEWSYVPTTLEEEGDDDMPQDGGAPMGNEDPNAAPMDNGAMGGEVETVIDVDDITNAQEKMNDKVNVVGQDLGKVDSKIEALLQSLSKMETMINNNNEEIAKFKADGSKAVRQKGYVLMCKYTGHKMYWWDHQEWLDRLKSFTQEFWEEYRTRHKDTGDAIALSVREHFQAASKWDRMALNSPTQGTGIVILKSAMTDFFNYIVDNGLFNRVKIVALVHDEANIEYPINLSMDIVLKECMEKAAAKFCKSLPIPAEAAVDICWRH